MVRVTPVLARIPVIKFRKGGLSSVGTATPAARGAPPPAAAAAQVQGNAPMSTSTIPDIDLPLRYRRAPLSEEEIAHINGGGITEPSKSQSEGAQIQTMGVIKVPRGVLIDCGNKKKEVVSLNIVLQRCQKK
ncbi:hypothetical protein PYW08_004550 [Mythimna loreyi]|uniref:Uncharacterized protein n=1 Tax=Mythimna loreyi TaxID=667449 RepID=A0ACC2QTB7_9NEOP|nr:hypothetical protein PYW08_004550 [Mythimna loreyi]